MVPNLLIFSSNTTLWFSTRFRTLFALSFALYRHLLFVYGHRHNGYCCHPVVLRLTAQCAPAAARRYLRGADASNFARVRNNRKYEYSGTLQWVVTDPKPQG